MANKKKASFWVILRSVLTEKKKKRAETIRKILAINRGEKSEISMGQIKATIPKTKWPEQQQLP